MNYKIIDNRIVLMSLNRNDYINKSIKSMFDLEQFKFGWIEGIGAVYNIEIAYYDIRNKKYIKKCLKDDYELISLKGNITFLSDDYFVHTHVVLSDREFKSFGGHLCDAQASAACEIKIDILDSPIKRNFSKDIGLNLWCIENGNSQN